MRLYTIVLIAFCFPVTCFCEETSSQIGVEEVAPVEDLMREHGLLERILLIYDALIERVDAKEPFPMEALKKSAKLVQSFIENYHEKLEETYLFPRLEKANVLVDLVGTLKEQHQRGREITSYLLANDGDRKKITTYLKEFTTMYRPHAAREDTILFPQFKKLITKKEYDALGELFEEKEHELFGKTGFEGVVQEVEAIEKELGIYNLAKFTPQQ